MKPDTRFALKMLVSGLATLALMILMIWKGFDNTPIFESIGAEIAFVSILFMGAFIFIIGGIKTLLDDLFNSSDKPQKF